MQFDASTTSGLYLIFKVLFFLRLRSALIKCVDKKVL